MFAEKVLFGTFIDFRAVAMREELHVQSLTKQIDK
jgi:hypothetical protein